MGHMERRLPEPRSGGKRGRPARLGVLVLGLSACAASAPPSVSFAGADARPLPAPGSELGPGSRRWVESTLRSLDLRQRVAQLVMVWMSGGYASATDAEQTRVLALVERDGIGGVVISLGTPHSYVSRLNRLQDASDVPLLVAADFEAGPGSRVGSVYALPSGLDMGGATTFPPAMAFGAARDERLAFEAGRVTAIEARAMGVHLSFAPVLDVNNNPDNPIINTRSYGEDPERVAALGAAYIRGAREGGLMTTAKHFPGHGDTGTDSHVALPTIPGDRARLDRVELVPFRRAIQTGVDAVMTAHVAATGILGTGAPPATLSPYFMSRLLRDELGFEGVLFTDALDMAAIVAGYGAGEASVRALEAGADVLLMPTDPVAAIDAVLDAVASGRLSETRIESSVARLLELKARAGLDRARLVDPDRIPQVVGVAAHLEVADSVARRSVTLVRDFEGQVPFDTSAVRRVLSVTLARDGNPVAGRVFDARLADAVEVSPARVRLDTRVESYDSLVAATRGVDVVVLSVYVPPSAVAEGVDVAPEVAAFLRAVDAAGTPIVVLSFGSPYLLASLPDARAYVTVWGGSPASQRAAADALLGRTDIGGTLPIALPPVHAIGEGITRARPATPRPASGTPGNLEAAPTEVGMDPAALARVDRLLEAAIRDGATPGAALAVGRHGRLVRLRGYGRLDWSEDAAPVTDSSLYDLASLTKVVATTTALMRLVDDGRLSLEDPIGRHLPEWDAGWKREVTVADLLLHRGGFPPFQPWWRDLRGRDAYRTAIAALEQEYPVAERTVYSDIGLITLGFVVEAVTGRPLDRYAEETVFGPLGLRDTGFNPPASRRARIAPTEVDSVFRHRHVHGEVHDENAFALGGVAGHAGLFSSARDLARFADWILDAARRGRGIGVREDPSPLRVPTPATVARFTGRVAAASGRALGWDTPYGLSSAGSYLSPGSFGHTGFTGTSTWVDPELDLFVVLLTNRVDPTRDNQKHIPLRRAVHDAVATSIRDMAIAPRPADPPGPDGGRR